MNKIKLLLILLLSTNTIVYSQSVMYNRGLLTIVGEDTTKTTLYVNGTMVVGTNPIDLNQTSNILMKKSKVLLTGDFINNVSTGTVFQRPASVTEEGVFEFRSASAQKIYTSGNTYATIPSKSTSYIDFPHLRINNGSHVTVDPSIGMQTQNIELKKGWLVLDSRKAQTFDYNGILTVDLQNNRTVLPHLLVNGTIDYQNWANPIVTDRGFIEVRLKLDDHKVTTAAETKSLVGFGSPFMSLKSDYFLYNHLWAPTNAGFFGDAGRTITDPNFYLKPGVGYATSIDVRGSDEANYLIDLDPNWAGTSFSARAKDGHYFNRFRFANDPTRNANQVNGTNVADSAYAFEKLNNTDIKVNLKPGYNYLANPFMSPLDITDLLKSNQSSAWGVVADHSGNTSRDIVNRVWILKGDATANAANPVTKVTATYNYYLAKEVGGTYTDEYEDMSTRVTIAPLQMFVVYSAVSKQITIPKSKRVMSNVKFIRSEGRRIDDFIIEVRDELTGRTDRANVVLRPANELSKPMNANVTKLNTSTITDEKDQSMEATSGVKQTMFSQIYTQDDRSANPLTVKFIAQGATATPLYLTPANQSTNISIKGLRLGTADYVKEIWLEDRMKGTKVLLTSDMEYLTSTSPNDPTSRFVLHFSDAVTGIEEQTQRSELLAYYDNNILHVSRFEVSDFGSVISLYDMSGKTVLKTIVDQEIMNIPQELISGAYIVKTTGKRTETTKLLVTK